MIEKLNKLSAGEFVFLKLTLPERDDLYSDCAKHPNIMRLLALSGGYSLKEGNARLRRNPGMVASFSRALAEGLPAQQSDAEFHARLDTTIQSIFDASTLKQTSTN